MNVQSSSSHFRKIEDLINQMSKMIGRGFDPLNRFYLARTEISIHTFAKKVDETNNRIEWCPELMRYVRKKIVLHAICAQKL